MKKIEGLQTVAVEDSNSNISYLTVILIPSLVYSLTSGSSMLGAGSIQNINRLDSKF